MNQFWYRAYGLTLSSNRMLTFATAAPEGRADVVIHMMENDRLPAGFKTLARGRWLPYPPARADDGLLHAPDAGLFGFRFRDTSEFVCSADGSAIWGSWDPDLRFEHVAAHVLNSVLGFTLRLRGLACLHASSVVVEGHAALFVGDSGMGKSTTAGGLARSGFPLLTDDFVALRPAGTHWLIDPGYPSLRLFLDSGRALSNGDSGALTPISPLRRKHYLNVTQSGSASATAAPLGMIYLLNGRAAHCETTPVTPLTATVELLRHLYPWRLIGAPEWARDFKTVAAVAQSVPTRLLTLPNRLDRLDEVIDLIAAGGVVSSLL